MDPWETFQNATYDLHELLLSMTIGTDDPSRPQITLTFGDERKTANDTLEDEKIAKFSTKYYDVFGRCFELEINPEVTALGIATIVIKGKVGLYVYIHHPEQFTEVDTKTKVGHFINPFYIATYGFTIEDHYPFFLWPKIPFLEDIY